MHYTMLQRNEESARCNFLLNGLDYHVGIRDHAFLRIMISKQSHNLMNLLTKTEAIATTLNNVTTVRSST